MKKLIYISIVICLCSCEAWRKGQNSSDDGFIEPACAQNIQDLNTQYHKTLVLNNL